MAHSSATAVESMTDRSAVRRRDQSNAPLRVHIAPFNPDLFSRVIPNSLQGFALNISYHSIQTFPERDFGFVELPRNQANALISKLNGTTLRGQKMSVQVARHSRKSREREQDKLRDKPLAPRRLDETTSSEIRGHQLDPARQIQRGWDQRVSDKRKKDPEKRSEVIRRRDGKPVEDQKMLFKAKVQPTTQSRLRQSRSERNKKDRKVTRTRLPSHAVVIEEFSNNRKIPPSTSSVSALLRGEPIPLDETPSTPYRRSTSASIQNVADVGADVMAEIVRTYPAHSPVTSSHLRQASHLISPDIEKGQGSTARDDPAISSTAEDLQPLDMADAISASSSSGHKKGFNFSTLSASSTDSETADGQEEPHNQKRRKTNKQSQDHRDAAGRTQTFSSVSSDEEADESELRQDNAGDKELEAESRNEVESGADQSTPRPSSDFQPVEDTESRTIVESVGQSGSHDDGDTTLPQPVHPLETLFKRPRENTSEPSKRKPAPIDTSFSFFDTSATMEDDDHVQDPQDNGQDMVAPTPHTQRDLERRGLRSAARTPDTAAIGRRARRSFPMNEDEDEDEDEDGHDDALDWSRSKTPVTKPGDADAERIADTAADTGVHGEESGFRRWFYENRGEFNRGWKRRRREARKMKRKRENQRLNRKMA